MSTKSAGLAVKKGFTNVKVMLQGAPGWKKSGQMVVASSKFIKEGNIILVDLRSGRDAAAGHIPRSVNIPVADLVGIVRDVHLRGDALIVNICMDQEGASHCGLYVLKEFGTLPET